MPIELYMDQPSTRYSIDLDTYKGEIAARFKTAWEVAQTHVKRVQKRQKTAYDRKAKIPTYRAGPYRITAVHNTEVEVRPVDRPQEDAICVALDRV